ncbi:PqqD family protein [Celeribacter persicus]|jgi:hypothetical protein|uniref:Coenzyme PQQ synthesis protein D (PqqD) n=1 Tax=Celeribacter persicus TaxID=1651082 RepID=A0A2T5HCM4_9RHOB|nr:PqqD family protein [Celeribacter persicus]PTQ69317.1 coenzyme PQQ synthesis protein D (PqqD) [Celeribacter persicus]
MKLRISESMMWNEVEGSVSFYHLETGDFQTLNETGSYLWMLVSDGMTRRDVLSATVGHFAAGNAELAVTVLSDTKGFLDTALANGWVVETVQ